MRLDGQLVGPCAAAGIALLSIGMLARAVTQIADGGVASAAMGVQFSFDLSAYSHINGAVFFCCMCHVGSLLSPATPAVFSAIGQFSFCVTSWPFTSSTRSSVASSSTTQPFVFPFSPAHERIAKHPENLGKLGFVELAVVIDPPPDNPLLRPYL